MIRIRIRHGDMNKKVLWFDESIEFPLLLRKICNKLGVTHERDDGDIDLSELFLLKLDDEGIVVPETNRIAYGDELVLERKPSLDDYDRKPSARPSRKNRSTRSINSHDKVETNSAVKQEYACPIKKEDPDEVDEDTNSGARKNCNDPVKKEDRDDPNSGANCGTSKNDNDLVKKEGSSDSDLISISSDEDDDSSYDDGTEEEYDSSSSEEEANSRRHKKSKLNPKTAIESPLEVIMKNRDIPSAPGKPDQKSDNNGSDNEMEEKSMLVNGAGKKKAEQEVKHRIIKLLNTGFHDQSNEHEAKNAMKLAQRLMRKHNLSQALLLKERESKNSQSVQDDEVLKGGMVDVNIINRKTRKPHVFTRWISYLSQPVSKNFGVKCYYRTGRGRCCEVTFYGIYTNAQLAGYAFKVAAERIAQMMTEYQPKKDWRNVSTKSSRLSYAIGIAKGISEDVERNLEMEKEQRKRKLERAQLAGSRGEAYEESDDEDFGIDDNDGPGISLVKEQVSSSSNNNDAPHNPIPLNHGNRESRSISGIDLQTRVEELEREEQAALVLVDHSEKIAEEVLEEHHVKLSNARARKPIKFDNQSYEKGIEDSREIDINQRAIRDEVKVKVEKS